MQTNRAEAQRFATAPSDAARPIGGLGQAIIPPPPANDVDAGPNLYAKGGLAPWQIRKVTAHVDSHLDDAVGVPELAALARLSVSQFSRAFKHSFGLSPHAYVMGRRIAQAQALMLRAREPLSQIAIAVGLADQAHLSKLFRRLTGETPNAWRRAHWDDAALPSAPLQ
ncbi:helix-turn-helix domain-containing protein [Caulobacter sp. KR2-114]|uniref:helix-turn-helix domain-containing protein n=1 Tax=Caulobacter sp. KR2-114 TaxID=3400912 RepID=UPI003C056FE6